MAGSTSRRYPPELRERTVRMVACTPWRTIDDVELATARWVDWFNHRLLYEWCGDIPPAEPEAVYYAQPRRPAAG